MQIGNLEGGFHWEGFNGRTMRLNKIITSSTVVEFETIIHNAVEWLEVFSVGTQAPKITKFQVNGKDSKEYSWEML